jgi:hypothetical protein
MSEAFAPAKLSLLTGFAQLYRSFKPVSFDFNLPAVEHDACAAFCRHKWEFTRTPITVTYEDFLARHLASKKADYLLAKHAQQQGFMIELNDELKTDVVGYDFVVTVPSLGALPNRVRFETKRMNQARDATIVFKTPFIKTHSCTNWRDYDLLLAWHIDSGLFKPWALIINQLMSSPIYTVAWKPNKGSEGGSHLNLATLPAPYNAGAIIL